MFETLELEDAKATETLFGLTEIPDTCKTIFVWYALSSSQEKKDLQDTSLLKSSKLFIVSVTFLSKEYVSDGPGSKDQESLTSAYIGHNMDATESMELLREQISGPGSSRHYLMLEEWLLPAWHLHFSTPTDNSGS